MPVAGDAVHHIELLECLGRGGMGEVWLGRDRRLGRKVAVKAVRPERRPDAAARARFLREARILSRLEHPHVCRLYDYVEEEDGAQYLVLEHVEGTSLEKLLETGELSASHRLDLAIQIADALAAAHSLSVVHRDLKPSNVLVTPEGDAKVLDFGLARPVAAMPEPLPRAGSGTPAPPDPRPAEGGTVTLQGDVLGTPRYMSPEQARGEPVTAASDAFALGLLLQELFTGRPGYPPDLTPPELRDKAMWGDRSPSATGVPQIDTLVDRLTALEPLDRPSAGEALRILREIRRAPERRRRRRLAIATLTVLLLLAAGLAVLSVRLRLEASRAVREARTAAATADVLVDLFEAANPYGSEAEEISARDLLVRGAEEVRGRLAEEPEIRARLLRTMGQIHVRLGEYERGAELLTEALAALGSDGHDAERFLALLELSDARLRSHRLEEAEARVDAALHLATHELRDEERRAQALHQRLLVLLARGRIEEAEDSGRRSLEIRERLLGPDDPATAATRGMLGLAVLEAGRPEDAEPQLAEALRLVEAHHRSDHPNVMLLRKNLATARRILGRLDEAEEVLRALLPRMESRLGPEHPDLAAVHNELGIVLLSRGRYGAAAEAYRRALAIAESRLGSTHPTTAMLRGNLAEALALDGRPEEAEPLYRECLQILRTALGDRHPILVDPLRGAARVQVALGRPEEATALLEEAVAIAESREGGDPVELGGLLATLGGLLQDEGRPEASAAVLERALGLLEPLVDPRDERLLELRKRLDRAAAGPASD